MFSAETEARFQHLVSIYPQKRSALIPMLLLAQRELGYVTPHAMEYIAAYLGLSASDVESTLSFYTLLRRKPGMHFATSARYIRVWYRASSLTRDWSLARVS